MELHRAVAQEARARPSTCQRRLRARFAPAGFCTSGRASGIRASRCRAGRSASIWRTDGEPLWQRRRADRRHHRRRATRRSSTAGDSASAWSRALGLPPAHLITAYEDVPKLLIDEARCRSTSTRCRPTSRKPGERARLARLLQARARQAGRVRAAAARPPSRRKRIGLGVEPVAAAARAPVRVAGDSPLGSAAAARLAAGPAAGGAGRRSPPVDPFAPREPLPKRGDMKPRPGRSARRQRRAKSIKTALDAARRAAGTCHVFMPPLERLEAYVALLAAIEDTARALVDCPSPSKATRRRAIARVKVLTVTPDPGVIEVNVHPSASWRELIATTTTLYEEARQTRLAHREVHARRPPHRHRRRQSRHARRRDAGRQPAAAPSRPAAQPHHLLAEPSGAVVPVLGHVHRPDDARRRASTRRATIASTSSRSRSSSWRRSSARRRAMRCRGWSIACCATC